MDLQKIYEYIDTQLESTEDARLKRVLIEINRMLEPRLDIYDNATLKPVMAYLQLIKISEDIFKPTYTLQEAMNDETFASPLKDHTYVPKQAFTGVSRATLITLYSLILQRYYLLPEWRGSYAATDQQEVTSPIIDHWLASISTPSNTIEAGQDLGRDIQFMGQAGYQKTPEQIKKLMTEMVARSQYTPEQQTLLIRWLEKNAETPDALATELIFQKAFDQHHLLTPAQSKAKFNWVVENGRVYFDGEMTLNALKYAEEEEKYLMATREGGVKILTSDYEFEQQKARVDKLFNRNNYYLPLMEFKYRMELLPQVDGTVRPVLRHLNVTSYTDKLQVPKDLILEKPAPLALPRVLRSF